MHRSSYLKMDVFVREYLSELTSAVPIKVLDVGSKSYGDHSTYRELFPAPQFQYVGLDIEHGPNVDLVPSKVFVWDEVETNSFDAIISGQTFEHNPFFWATFAEISRVLRPGGLACVIAPGSGRVHRYPVDCWRFYPDSWAALCSLTQMELVESYYETDSMTVAMPGNHWRDSAVIARKPQLTGKQSAAFHARLDKVVEVFRDGDFPVAKAPPQNGRWTTRYQQEMLAESPLTLGKKICYNIKGSRFRTFQGE